MALLKSVLILLGTICTATVVGSVRKCPTWFGWANASNSSGYCILIPEVIKCDQKTQNSFLELASCAFYDSESDIVVAAQCPFLFKKTALTDNRFLLPESVLCLWKSD